MAYTKFRLGFAPGLPNTMQFTYTNTTFVLGADCRAVYKKSGQVFAPDTKFLRCSPNAMHQKMLLILCTRKNVGKIELGAFSCN